MDRYFLMLVLNDSQYNSIIDSSKTTGCHVQEGSNTPKTGEFTMFALHYGLLLVFIVYLNLACILNANSKAASKDPTYWPSFDHLPDYRKKLFHPLRDVI